MLKISAIIPAYNAEAFILEAIRSIEAQTYPIDEIIVVDDGSKDGTVAKVEQYGSKRVKLVRKPNGGSASARNLGIQVACGDVIAFLDADDQWLPQKVEKQIERMQQTGAALVYCGKVWVDEQGRPIVNRDPQVSYPEGEILKDLIQGNYITSTSCVVATRESLEAVDGFNEIKHVAGAEDHELWLRMAKNYRFAATREELVLYRRHSSNMTNNRQHYYSSSVSALDHFCGQLNEQEATNELRVLINARIKKLITGAILEMFYLGHYADQRKFVRMAIKRRLLSWRHIDVVLLSFLPDPMIRLLRKTMTGLRGPAVALFCSTAAWPECEGAAMIPFEEIGHGWVSLVCVMWYVRQLLVIAS